ncbi:MAG: hypothetical protein AVDCRST_MAG38-660, partial [uncultured Solirubrobacteraceae bacterium]
GDRARLRHAIERRAGAGAPGLRRGRSADDARVAPRLPTRADRRRHHLGGARRPRRRVGSAAAAGHRRGGARLGDRRRPGGRHGAGAAGRPAGALPGGQRAGRGLRRAQRRQCRLADARGRPSADHRRATRRAGGHRRRRPALRGGEPVV